jgi:Spy/CpxP family protein refolding chaperone
VKAGLVSIVAAGLLVVCPGEGRTQHTPGHGHVPGNAHHQPYAGRQAREVSLFSAEEIKGHLEGRGMGYALPAELNGYPGPLHVLELRDDLRLTTDQVKATETLYNRMRERAKLTGRAYIEAEKALDVAFKSGKAEAGEIRKLVRAADDRRTEMRLSHLEAHLEMARLLSADQRKSYAVLRGYGAKEKP